MDSVELISLSNIGPGRVGFFQEGSGSFQCTTRATLAQRWVINNFDIDFDATDTIRSKQQSFATAHLVDVSVDGTTFIGNRTSLLVITPDPSFTGVITVSCSNGGTIQVCPTSVEVIGKYSNVTVIYDST